MNSVRVISANKQKVDQALSEFIEKISERDDILEVYLFGSFAKGNYSPFSDVDLLIVVNESDERFLDRVPQFIPDTFPTGIDILVFTEEEASKSDFVKKITKSGKLLYGV